MSVVRTTTLFLLAFLLSQSSSLVQLAHAETQRTLRYSNGEPRWVYETSYGRPDGVSRVFYPDGTLMVEGTYVKGWKHGLFKYYSADGRLLEKALYVYGDRMWRVRGESLAKSAPLELLRDDPIEEIYEPDNVELERAPPPYLPFVAMDRHSKRFGLMAGISGNGDADHGRRAEFFTNIVKGDLGLYLSGSVSQIPLEKLGSKGGIKYDAEQGTLDAALSYRGIELDYGHLYLRGGYLRSFRAVAEGIGEVQGLSKDQRPGDLVAAFEDASALRASTSFVRRQNKITMQFDVGIDRFSFAEDRADASGTIFRFNGAAGYVTRYWQATVESVNSISSAGSSIFSLSASGTYLGDSLWWTSAQLLANQDFHTAFVISTGSFLWRVD